MYERKSTSAAKILEIYLLDKNLKYSFVKISKTFAVLHKDSFVTSKMDLFLIKLPLYLGLGTTATSTNYLAIYYLLLYYKRTLSLKFR